MGDWLRHYTAEEIQAALGDEPFVVRGLWPGGASADPTPAPGPPEWRPSAEPPEPRHVERRSLSLVQAPDAAAGEEDSRGRSPRRWPAPRRWPLVLLLSGTALSGLCFAVWMLPPTPPPHAAMRPAPAPPLRLAWTAAPAPPLGTLAPTSALDSTFAGGDASPHAADARLPVEPPEAAPAVASPPPPEKAAAPKEPVSEPPASEAAAPETTAPVFVAAPGASNPVGAPEAPRLSNPILAAALMQRAEAALARADIAAARAFFIRAASVDPWSVEALVGAGRTYDPEFLRPLGVTGGLADPAQARQWYERASQLGDPVATGLAGKSADGR